MRHVSPSIPRTLETCSAPYRSPPNELSCWQQPLWPRGYYISRCTITPFNTSDWFSGKYSGARSGLQYTISLTNANDCFSREYSGTKSGLKLQGTPNTVTQIYSLAKPPKIYEPETGKFVPQMWHDTDCFLVLRDVYILKLCCGQYE